MKLIDRSLKAGALTGDGFEATLEGTPQGGPLSPLLANLLLDGLDKELEKRGHRFGRYADDGHIDVRSARAGARVLASGTRSLKGRLKLAVNAAKRAVDRPWRRAFLGFSFTARQPNRRQGSAKALKTFKQEIRRLTHRTRGVSLPQVVQEVRRYARGGTLTLATRKPRPSSRSWIPGSDAAFGATFGSNGGDGDTGNSGTVG